jgi:hypothetical protein
MILPGPEMKKGEFRYDEIGYDVPEREKYYGYCFRTIGI